MLMPGAVMSIVYPWIDGMGKKTHSCMHFYTAHTNTQTYIAPLAGSVEVGSQKK